MRGRGEKTRELGEFVLEEGQKHFYLLSEKGNDETNISLLQ
jgi:hypothetical protein